MDKSKMKCPVLNKALFLLCILQLANHLKAQSIVILQQGKPTSLRGLSVVDDSVAWISGSKGYIAVTSNGGKNWDWQQVKGFEKADFRDIEAFSDKEAVIISSGTPALILKTIDGGASWQEKYRNTDTAYFFDAMDFANPRHGLVLGDPIRNKFVLMETIDGGDTWKMFEKAPDALPGEAAFAASGTCIRFDQYSIAIVTGGSRSRILSCTSGCYPFEWVYKETLIKHSKPYQGAFSISDTYGSVIVGGDYQNDHLTDSVAQYIFYNGKEFAPENGLSLSKKPPSGFQSCVAFINGETFLSTGTTGSNITRDGGKTWTQIDDKSFNTCCKAKHGKLVLLAGNSGTIGRLQMQHIVNEELKTMKK